MRQRGRARGEIEIEAQRQEAERRRRQRREFRDLLGDVVRRDPSGSATTSASV